MTITLSEEMTERLQSKVLDGLYASAEEAVREAFRLLDEYDELKSLEADLLPAVDQAARGEVVEWSDELSQQLLDQARERHRQGAKSRLND